MSQSETRNQIVDDILDRLEAAQQENQPLTVEQACCDHPELIDIVKVQWAKLNRFGQKFGSSVDASKNSADTTADMTGDFESLMGRHLTLSTEIVLSRFHANGGLSDVYQGTETELSREVAVKVLRVDRETESNRIDFRREAEIIGRLNHPGIVSILGFGETIEGRPFYTMPFFGKGNLSVSVNEYHLENPSKLQPKSQEFRQLLGRLISACKTVAYAHSRGIVHRDLKTENIMLGSFGETLVIDWGCAAKFSRDERFKASGEKTLQLPKELNESSSNGMTLRYASPEQLRGAERVGPECDIYSLGAILYRLLTGESPYQRVPDAQVPKQVLTGTLPAPKKIKAGVPVELNAVCLKAMSKQPEGRYQTALELAEDLERYMSDASVNAHQDSVLELTVRVVRRHQRAAAVAFISLVALAIALTFLSATQSVLRKRADTAASDRLKLAATLAATAGSAEIDRRWRILEAEALNPALIQALIKCDTDRDDKSAWEAVQNILDRKSNQYERIDGLHHESLFVISSHGTQVARTPYSTQSVGEDFSFRDYFHGLGREVSPDEPTKISDQPVLSIVYVSTVGGLVKTAFSVPVKTIQDGRERVIGRLCMSVPINQLQIFRDLGKLSIETALVETRDYARGLIIDSPRLSLPEFPSNSHQDPKEIIGKLPRVPESMLAESPEPVADSAPQARFSKKLSVPALGLVDGEVAYVPIHVPNRAGKSLDTGWFVLLFETQN